MKKILLVVLAVIAVTSVTVARDNKKSQDRKFQVYGVAFYNLENLFDTINNNGKYDREFTPDGPRKWNSDKYWKKQHNMAYAISQMNTKITPKGPAVIGISEVENITVLQDLVKQPEVKDMNLQIVHHDSPDRRGIDVGLLYNPRFFRVLNVTNTTLKIEGNDHFRSRDVMCVTGMLGNDKVSILVNHWPSRLGGQERSNYLREAAAALNKHVADSCLAVDPNQGIIIMGDLNDDPMNSSCAEVLGAKKKIKDVKPGGYFNPWWQTLDKGIGTLAYRGQWNLFDQIIISDYFINKDQNRLKYFKHSVHNWEFLKTKEGERQGYPLRTFVKGAFTNGYSDHFPTQVFFVKRVK